MIMINHMAQLSHTWPNSRTFVLLAQRQIRDQHSSTLSANHLEINLSCLHRLRQDNLRRQL